MNKLVQQAEATPSNDEKVTPQAYYVLAVLLAAYILSFVDRNVMAVLIGPIRQDLDISDFQYSLLHGFAFSMFYIVLGIPIARLADHSNRKWIVTIGIFFWSIMCCLCGLAKSIVTLFIAVLVWELVRRRYRLPLFLCSLIYFHRQNKPERLQSIAWV